MGDFKERLTLARKRKGYTQGELADKLGFKSGKQTVYNWEKGEREPSLSQVVQLAEALGTTVVWLIEGSDEIAAPAPSVVQETPPGYVTVPAEEYIDMQRRLIKQQQEELDKK